MTSLNKEGKPKALWALVPASGVGSRMEADRPKQYLTIYNRFILDLTISRLLSVPELSGVMVVLAEEDAYWSASIYANHPKVYTAIGGNERFHSVLNGLNALDELADEDSWVMVHDAARPCVRVSDIESLLSQIKDSDGGLLGVPAKDTVKRSMGMKYSNQVKSTLDRSTIWLAYTPQVFQQASLKEAIKFSIENGYSITDDASAMELAGYNPLLVEGARDNIKITHPEDLALAEWYLERQKQSN
jgi:2-C-methyl-D-erythritol 4-phosphate cytidylyltransferase